MTVAKHDISGATRTALMKRTKYAYPKEVCGFIMNSADPDTDQYVFEVPNIAKRPEHSWQMDPEYQRLVMLDQDNVFGVWHSHPHGPDGPSETDLKYQIPGMRFFVATFNGVFEYGMREGA